jgi:hypothetical protein
MTASARALTIRRETHTGYWRVQRGSVPLSGGPSREAAEAERELLERLHDRVPRRRRERRLPSTRISSHAPVQ